MFKYKTKEQSKGSLSNVIHNLRHIRSHFFRGSFETVSHSFFIFHLEYCKSLFAVLPPLLTTQLVQNLLSDFSIAVANFFMQLTPLLRDFHLLPIKLSSISKSFLFYIKFSITPHPLSLIFLSSFSYFLVLRSFSLA